MVRIIVLMNVKNGGVRAVRKEKGKEATP